MTPFTRRAAISLGAVFAFTLPFASLQAADTLPDARFVGYAQQINDFEIGSARLALTKSSNENVRGFATRALPEYTDAAERLSKSRTEAGVTYAPDPSKPPNTIAVLQRLGALEGPEFDTAYANAQLAILADAEAQYGANSQSNGGGMQRYAQYQLPKIRMQLEFARRLAGGL